MNYPVHTYSADFTRHTTGGTYTGVFIKDGSGKITGFLADGISKYFPIENVYIGGFGSPELFTKTQIIAYEQSESNRWQRYLFTYMNMNQLTIVVLSPVRNILSYPDGYDNDLNDESKDVTIYQADEDELTVIRTKTGFEIKTGKTTVTLTGSGKKITVGESVFEIVEDGITLNGQPVKVQSTTFKKDGDDLKQALNDVADKIVSWVYSTLSYGTLVDLKGFPIIDATDPDGTLLKSDIQAIIEGVLE